MPAPLTTHTDLLSRQQTLDALSQQQTLDASSLQQTLDTSSPQQSLDASSRDQQQGFASNQQQESQAQDHPSSPRRADLLALRRRLKTNATILLVSLLFSAVVLALMFTFLEGIFPVLLYDMPSGLVFNPGESRAFHVNKFLCSSVSIDTSGSSHLSASFFISKNESTLSEYSSKEIRETLECEGQCYISWRLYLHQGSTVNLRVNSSLSEENIAYFINFTDMNSFAEFTNSDLYPYSAPDKSHAFYKEGEIQEVISKNSAGDYIFALFSLNPLLMNITLEFNRTEFSTPANPLNSCSTHSYTNTKCKLPIPFGIGTVYGLLRASYDGPGEEKAADFEYMTVHTECNYRGNSWTVIWAPVMLLNLVTWCPLLALLLWLRYRCLLKQYGIDNIPDSEPQSTSSDSPAEPEVDSVSAEATPDQDQGSTVEQPGPLPASPEQDSDAAAAAANSSEEVVVDVHPHVENLSSEEFEDEIPPQYASSETQPLELPA